MITAFFQINAISGKDGYAFYNEEILGSLEEVARNQDISMYRGLGVHEDENIYLELEFLPRAGDHIIVEVPSIGVEADSDIVSTAIEFLVDKVSISSKFRNLEITENWDYERNALYRSIPLNLVQLELKAV